MTNMREINLIWKKNNRINTAKGKLTYGQIAAQLGINLSALTKITSGSVGVYLHRIVQISETIGCLPCDLLPPQWVNNTSLSINMGDVANIAEIFSIIDEVEKEKKTRLSDDAKAKTFIALYLQLKQRYDNDNCGKKDMLNYASAYLDAVLINS